MCDDLSSDAWLIHEADAITTCLVANCLRIKGGLPSCFGLFWHSEGNWLLLRYFGLVNRRTLIQPLVGESAGRHTFNLNKASCLSDGRLIKRRPVQKALKSMRQRWVRSYEACFPSCIEQMVIMMVRYKSSDGF